MEGYGPIGERDMGAEDYAVIDNTSTVTAQATYKEQQTYEAVDGDSGDEFNF